MQHVALPFPGTHKAVEQARRYCGEIPGRPRFFALDPFGNALEFVEFKPDHW